MATPKKIKAWAIVFKVQCSGAITYSWIEWQFQIFQNRRYALKRLTELYPDIAKHLKVIPVLITPIPKKIIKSKKK